MVSPSRILSTAVAIGVGLVVLLTYFIQQIGPTELQPLRTVLLHWATTLAAVALLVGILNLVRVHVSKLDSGGGAPIYSGLLLAAFLAVLGVSLYPPGPSGSLAGWAFQYVIAPVEAAVGGLIFFFLVFAGYRLMRVRRSLGGAVFLGVAVVVLVGLIPLDLPGAEGAARGLADLHNWIVQVWAVAGTRGILLGVALGTVATGLRVLLAADRPYGN